MIPKEHIQGIASVVRMADAAQRQADAAERQAVALERMADQGERLNTELGNITGILTHAYEQGWG